jgi:uncharacterized DUF497 family protein
MKFEWDENKNLANIAKHEVSFERAETVFDDPNALYFYDEIHSDDEDRYIVIGIDNERYALTVCHCYRGRDEDIVRIISARNANKYEKSLYWEVR